MTQRAEEIVYPTEAGLYCAPGGGPHRPPPHHRPRAGHRWPFRPCPPRPWRGDGHPPDARHHGDPLRRGFHRQPPDRRWPGADLDRAGDADNRQIAAALTDQFAHEGHGALVDRKAPESDAHPIAAPLRGLRQGAQLDAPFHLSSHGAADTLPVRWDRSHMRSIPQMQPRNNRKTRYCIYMLLINLMIWDSQGSYDRGRAGPVVFPAIISIGRIIFATAASGALMRRSSRRAASTPICLRGRPIVVSCGLSG